MSRPIATRLTAASLGLALLLLLGSIPLLILNIPRTGVDWSVLAVSYGAGVLYSGLGGLVAWRQPRNAIGWMLLAIGLSSSLESFIREYTLRAFVTAPGSLPLAGPLAWLSWLSNVFISFLPLFLLLFPDGRLPSRRWRPLVWLTVVWIVLSTLRGILTPDELTEGNRGINYGFALIPNPTGVPALRPILPLVTNILGTVFLVIAVGVLASLVSRYRHGREEERQQVKWLAYAVGLAVTVLLIGVIEVNLVPPVVNGKPGPGQIAADLTWLLGATIVYAGFPAAATIAILKYRLYDIDVVISRSLVYGALAGLIGLVYVLVVVGVGTALGTHGQPNLALSIAATALVAVAFQPARARLERFANRLVYGKRATPYQVLSEFSDQIAAAYSSEEMLPRLARTCVEATGAVQSAVWIRNGSDDTPIAWWPDREDGTGPSRVVPVRYQGEVLGALSVKKARGDAITPLDEKILEDLAVQAGVVLRNVRLTSQLEARLAEIAAQTDELQASSARIVAAQDATRRRLERNIHDGAQQHLVALAVKLRLAASMAKRDPARATDLLSELQTETAEALEAIQGLARGIYPPILRERGLEPALRAHAAKLDVPIVIHARRMGRYPSEMEAAAYFCCLEALQNVAKHAGATTVKIALEQQDGQLRFSIADDGVGFDAKTLRRGSGLQNMADRLAALGGDLEVDSSSGHGTIVRGRVPVEAMEAVG
jgi:signal transduction histidine kinase